MIAQTILVLSFVDLLPGLGQTDVVSDAEHSVGRRIRTSVKAEVDVRRFFVRQVRHTRSDPRTGCPDVISKNQIVVQPILYLLFVSSREVKLRRRIKFGD